MNRKRSRSRKRSTEGESHPSWVTPETLKFSDPLMLLHEEILDFYEYIRPRAEEVKTQQDLISRLKLLVRSIWPQARLEVFGSIRTGLWVPNSDIDLVIIVEGSPQKILEKLAQNIIRSHMSSYIERVFSAKVPILKVVDRVSGIPVDISCNMENGLEGVALVQEYLEKYPEAKYIICVLKIFLRQRSLNETYSGGIGSFLLFCLVVSSLQQHPSRKEEISHYGRFTLGHYLMHFLELYGSQFNYQHTGITITNGGGYFSKKTRSMLLSVECPQNPKNDLAKNSYKIATAMRAFAVAHKQILTFNRECTTPLQVLIRNDLTIQNRKPIYTNNE